MTEIRWERRPRKFYDLRVISSYVVPGWALAAVLLIMLTHLREMRAEPLGAAVLGLCLAMSVVAFMVARGLDRKHGFVTVITDGKRFAVFENAHVLLVLSAAELHEHVRPLGRGLTISGFEEVVFWSGSHLGAKVLERMATSGRR